MILCLKSLQKYCRINLKPWPDCIIGTPVSHLGSCCAVSQLQHLCITKLVGPVIQLSKHNIIIILDFINFYIVHRYILIYCLIHCSIAFVLFLCDKCVLLDIYLSIRCISKLICHKGDGITLHCINLELICSFHSNFDTNGGISLKITRFVLEASTLLF